MVMIFLFLNQRALEWLSVASPELCAEGLTAQAYGLIVGLVNLGLYGIPFLILTVLPLHHVASFSSTLKSWYENRILDELTATGLGAKVILKDLSLFHLKRWTVVAAPVIVFGVLWSVLFNTYLLYGWLVYAGLISIIFTSTSSLATWRIVLSRTDGLSMLAPILLICVPPLLLVFCIVNYELDWPGLWVGFFFTILYVWFASYLSAVWVLEQRSRLEDLASKARRTRFFRTTKIKRRAKSENPIIAREEMLGRSFGDFLRPLVMLGVLLFAGTLSAQVEHATPIHLILLLLGLTGAWRAADRLSQSLTQEREGETLELLRTTPMGAGQFLSGWLHVTLRPLLLETGAFIAVSVSLLLYNLGPDALLDRAFFLCLMVVLTAPYLGALLGASIAGQCRPRQDISSQILSAMVVGSLFWFPQWCVLIASPRLGWESIAADMLLIVFLYWALTAGAKKSLNRVFLPQK